MWSQFGQLQAFFEDISPRRSGSVLVLPEARQTSSQAVGELWQMLITTIWLRELGEHRSCLWGLLCKGLERVTLKITAQLWGAWVAQSVKRPTSAQVMISRFMGLSPASGPGLTTQSLEPALGSVSLSLSAPPPIKNNFKKTLKKIPALIYNGETG